MAYLEQLQSGFSSLVQAGEAGRHNIDDMMGPVNGAIGDITGAADELSSLPFVPPGMGEEKLTLKGVIYPAFKGGLKQPDTLRSIGAQLLPLNLTTGYGQVLGTWCLRSIEEEQGALLAGGIPRKQSFTLEFTRYGDDLQNA